MDAHTPTERSEAVIEAGPMFGSIPASVARELTIDELLLLCTLMGAHGVVQLTLCDNGCVNWVEDWGSYL